METPHDASVLSANASVRDVLAKGFRETKVNGAGRAA
jgi:hypothetical protein